MNNKLIITIGAPLAGKSTWAKELLQKEPGKWKIVNRDSLRLMFDNYIINNKNEEFISEIEKECISKALSHHYSVINDATHLKMEYINEIREVVEEHNTLYNDNVEVVLKYFPITLKEALERNEKRIGQPKVPEKVIKDMVERYNKNVPFILKPLPNKKVIQDISLPKAIICDLDGSLAIHQERSPYDETKVLEDKVDENVKETVLLYYNSGYKIIICSGRTDVCREDSEIWLKINEIPFEKLFMRKSGDHRKDYVVKEEIFRNDILPFYFTNLVLDDRSSVVEKCWRSLGLKTYQLASGDF